MNKKIHIIGGGTVYHLRPHFAISAPAYGTTAKLLADLYKESPDNNLDTHLHLTKMCGKYEGSGYQKDYGGGLIQDYELETNQDISILLSDLILDNATKIIVMNAALCDYEGAAFASKFGCTTDDPGDPHIGGKYGERLQSRQGIIDLRLTPAEKIVSKIRRERKDIFAIAFKATCGLTPDEQYIAGLNLLKESSLNLVFANDVKTRHNMIITPEEARYHDDDREATLKGLVEMSLARSHLTFTRSTVVAGDPIPWNSELVPTALRTVVNYCIGEKAYKPFRGATVGHFAAKIDDNTFLTSIRKSNFNDLEKNGLVKVITDGPDSVIAYGSKPSVGGTSQRIIFHEHQEYDCIVHFHCPKKEGSEVPTISQKEYECGSHQCGQNTSNGLKKFGNLSAVFLDNHGPNIVFNRSIDPQEVINFIEANFDLSGKTGGYV